MVYGTACEVDPVKAVGSVGVKAAVRLWVPAASELVDVVAVPAVTLTAGPRLAPSDWNWTLPTAAGGVALAVRLTIVPGGCGLGGAAVRVVVVPCVCVAGGGHQGCVQVVPLTLLAACRSGGSQDGVGPVGVNRGGE